MRIKNWEKFQHFKDRRPPWIKLYRDLLDDDEWYQLPPPVAKTLVLLWLLASEDDTMRGTLPPLRKLAFRLRLTENALKSHISELSHWLIHDDITPISERYQLGPSETETKTEAKTETHSNGRANGKTSLPDQWILTEEAAAGWRKFGLNPQIEFASFKDHARTHDRRCKDWEAAFRNWCRKSIANKEKRP